MSKILANIFATVVVAVVLSCYAVVLSCPVWIIGGAMWLDYASCRSTARGMHVAANWGPLQDCLIEVDGRMIPLDSYRVGRVEKP